MATKKKSSKFLSGALIGAALGIAAGIFSSSKTGKQMKKEVKGQMADFYQSIAPKLKTMKKVGEQEYKLFINKALADYNKDGKFDKKDLKNLAKQANASWKHLKKHL
jgi:gas vesicle protein